MQKDFQNGRDDRVEFLVGLQNNGRPWARGGSCPPLVALRLLLLLLLPGGPAGQRQDRLGLGGRWRC